MNRDRRERLRRLLVDNALIEGQFTLSSGRVSDYYLDAKLVIQDPEGLDLVAEAFLDILGKYDVQAVGGPVQGAVPIAAAVALRSNDTGRRLPAFFVRAEAKEHGTRKAVEGPVKAPCRVAVVDDVITSGRSVVEALQEIRAAGFEVEVVASLVDRESGGAELIREHCPRYERVFTISEIRGSAAYSRSA